MSFDITDDEDPRMADRVAELRQRRYDSMPDITKLVSELGEYSGSAASGPYGE